MLRAVTHGFIATTVLIWLAVYSRVSYLQSQSSKTAQAVSSFARGRGDVSAAGFWQSELSSFDFPHPLLTPASREAKVIAIPGAKCDSFHEPTAVHCNVDFLSVCSGHSSCMSKLVQLSSVAERINTWTLLAPCQRASERGSR